MRVAMNDEEQTQATAAEANPELASVFSTLSQMYLDVRDYQPEYVPVGIMVTAKKLLADREAAVREAEQRACRKIQAVINAHHGLNTDAEVLSLVEASLPVIDQLEAEAVLTYHQPTNTKEEEQMAIRTMRCPHSNPLCDNCKAELSVMSSQSDQELRDRIEAIVISVGPTPWQRKEAFEEIMQAIHQRDKVRDAYVIGEDKLYPPEFEGDTSVLSRELLDHFLMQSQFDYRYWGGYNCRSEEQRHRAAEWNKKEEV